MSDEIKNPDAEEIYGTPAAPPVTPKPFERVYLSKGVAYVDYDNEDHVLPPAIGHRVTVNRRGDEVDAEIELSVFDGDNRVVRFGEYFYGPAGDKHNQASLARAKVWASRLLEAVTDLHTAVMAAEKHLAPVEPAKGSEA
jgi:hypothetical protein